MTLLPFMLLSVLAVVAPGNVVSLTSTTTPTTTTSAPTQTTTTPLPSTPPPSTPPPSTPPPSTPPPSTPPPSTPPPSTPPPSTPPPSTPPPSTPPPSTPPPSTPPPSTPPPSTPPPSTPPPSTQRQPTLPPPPPPPSTQRQPTLPPPPSTPRQSTPARPTGNRQCSVHDETVTMFNQDTAPLKIPCKYRLADFTCGDYQVKVTPGNTVTMHGGFAPDTAWVKVINIVTMETVKVRTSRDLLEKSEAGTGNAWKIQEGSTGFLDFAGYDAGVARLEKNGVFKVEFTLDSVEVSCSAEEFASPGLPETLCGDGLTPGELEAAANSTFGFANYMEKIQYLQYATLNDTTVTQSKACEALPSHFQSCDSKVDALKFCHSVFSSEGAVQCFGSLGKPVQDFFDDCLKFECDGDSTVAPPLHGCLM